MARIRAATSHVFLALLIATLVASLVAGTTFAAKGGGQGKPSGGGGSGAAGGGSLALVMVTDANGTGLPNWGDTVTFNVSTTATDQPFVRLHCYQGGTRVYWASAGFFDSYPWPWTRNFVLASTYWTGGAADCTATLYLSDGSRSRDLATLSFRAEA